PDPDVKAGANVLVIPTAGDMNVPVNTGIAMARAAGTLMISKEEGKDVCFDAAGYGDAGKCASFKGCEIQAGCETEESCATDVCKDTAFCRNFDCCDGKRDYSPLYKALSGKGEVCLSENDVLIYFHGLESVERFRRFAFYPFCDCREVLFDADNLSDGTDGFDAPSLSKPVRASVKTGNGWQMMRIPYVKPTGTHGFGMPNPDKPFPVDNYMYNLIGYYFYTSGNPAVLHDKCFADSSCPFFPWNK
ncbi:MAG: hypothetical protein FJ088_10990, partial [Deltaproteobacteria bacterium]|nr:hypothetical protein [Deltaproteobacteria bacterium]